MEMSALVGPLQQFQGKKAERQHTRELLEAINTKSTTPVETSRLDKLFDKLWSDLEEQLANIPDPGAEARQVRTHSEILEDLVQSVRAIEFRLREVGDNISKHDDLLQSLVKFDDDILNLNFLIIANDPVGNLQKGTKLSMLGPVTRLIQAIASRAGVKVEEYGSCWGLRDLVTDKSLTRYDVLELSSKYRGQICQLGIEIDIPF
jgi:hypothetical protein